MFWLLEVPNLRKRLAKFDIHVVPKGVWEAREELDKWALDLVNRTEEDIAEASLERTHDGDHPVVYSKLRRAVINEQQIEGMNQHFEIANECLDYLNWKGRSITNRIALKLTSVCSGDSRWVRYI